MPAIDQRKIEEWQAAAEEAPPEPYQSDYVLDERAGGTEVEVLRRDERADRFYAAAREAVPALLAEREELVRQRDDLARSGREASAMFARAVRAAGGEVRIPSEALMAPAPEFARTDDPTTLEVVFRTRDGGPSRSELLALLREVAEAVKRCPRCGMSYCAVPEDHAPDCRLGALLGRK